MTPASRDKETDWRKSPSLDWPPRGSSQTEVAGAALLLQHFQFCFCGLSPASPWLQRTAGEPAPLTTRTLAAAKTVGPVLLSQAVLKKVRCHGLEAPAKPSRPTERHLELGLDPSSWAGGWETPSQPHSSRFLARPSTSNRTGQEGGSHRQTVSPWGTT